MTSRGASSAAPGADASASSSNSRNRGAALDSVREIALEVRLSLDEGWSGLHDIPMGNRDHRVTFGYAADDNDTLVEGIPASASGSSRHIGTERVGSAWRRRGNNSWREPTLLALEANPRSPAYRQRLTVDRR
jgi:hypothetical protein